VTEGKQIQYFVTKYERIKAYRDQAIKIHGYSCKVCSINFKEKYGELGEGFIHIHHVQPLYSLNEETIPDPKNDLVPVCPNCHAMIHRQKPSLTIEELKVLITKAQKEDESAQSKLTQ
jgi:5-methylcytosine-specific restriction protein A